jgi:hypothetical protein
MSSCINLNSLDSREPSENKEFWTEQRLCPTVEMYTKSFLSNRFFPPGNYYC